MSLLFPDIQELIFKTIFEICEQCQSSLSSNEISTMYQYLETNYSTLKPKYVGILVEGISFVCSARDNPTEISSAINQISKIAVTYLVGI